MKFTKTSILLASMRAVEKKSAVTLTMAIDVIKVHKFKVDKHG